MKSGDSENSEIDSPHDGGPSEGENCTRFSSSSVSPGMLSDEETAERMRQH